jgi:hypothetical protein
MLPGSKMSHLSLRVLTINTQLKQAERYNKLYKHLKMFKSMMSLKEVFKSNTTLLRLKKLCNIWLE